MDMKTWITKNVWSQDLETGHEVPLSEVLNTTAAGEDMEKATIHKNIKHAVHSTVQELKEQGVEWDYHVSYREGINPDVHARIITTVMRRYPTMLPASVFTPSMISPVDEKKEACRSYFMTRKTRAKRIQTNRVEEARKKQRKRQRMTNTRTRRLTALTGITSGIKLSDRLRLEDALSTTTYISSQESESDDGVGPKCLAVKKLTWRSDFLDHWFTILDADHVKNDRCLSRREKGEESHRPPPTDGPSWAVKIPK